VGNRREWLGHFAGGQKEQSWRWTLKRGVNSKREVFGWFCVKGSEIQEGKLKGTWFVIGDAWTLTKGEGFKGGERRSNKGLKNRGA